MQIVFSGSIGRFPFGGHAWANMQYLAGLTALGHQVFYLEDCGASSYMYDWEQDKAIEDLGPPADYVRSCLELIGMGERYVYRAGDQSRGMPLSDFADVCAEADLLIVRAVPFVQWRPGISPLASSGLHRRGPRPSRKSASSRVTRDSTRRSSTAIISSPLRSSWAHQTARFQQPAGTGTRPFRRSGYLRGRCHNTKHPSSH